MGNILKDDETSLLSGGGKWIFPMADDGALDRGMKVHVLHRLLLIPLTMLGVTFLVFSLLQGQVTGLKEYGAWLGVDESSPGLLQGDLGYSELYHQPVLEVIQERLPIALYFWILATVIVYALVVPLGMVKALHHQGIVDRMSGVVMFLGYAIPGFILGILGVSFAGQSSITQLDFSVEQSSQLFLKTIWPLGCYVAMSFASLTMMMKHSLMNELASDYFRSAISKGEGFYRAVFRHAFRNSLIPMATSLGPLMMSLVGGSLLIEVVFDIQGLGLLQLKAIEAGDQMLIMGSITVGSLFMMTGKFVADVLASVLEPKRGF